VIVVRQPPFDDGIKDKAPYLLCPSLHILGFEQLRDKLSPSGLEALGFAI
jgi:hypothetical protein